MVGNPFNEALKSDNLMKLKPKSGGNKLIWDMRYPGFTSFDGMVLYSSKFRSQGCSWRIYFENDL